MQISDVNTPCPTYGKTQFGPIDGFAAYPN